MIISTTIIDTSFVELTRKAPAWSRLCHVDTETDRTHSSHSHNVQPCTLDPLSKGRFRVPGLATIVVLGAVMFLTCASRSLRVGVDRSRLAVEEAHGEGE